MRKLQLPPTITHTKVADAAIAYGKHTEELQRLQAAVRQLEQQRAAATVEDRRKLAVALASGRKDPGRSELDRLDQEVSALARRYEALQLVVANAEAKLGEAVEQHRGEWLKHLGQQAAAQREELRAAVESVRHAAHALALTQATTEWARGFPARTKWNPGMSARVPGLPAPNGELPTIEQILAALLQLCEPPKPSQPTRMLVQTDRTGRQLAPTAGGSPLVERLA